MSEYRALGEKLRTLAKDDPEQLAFILSQLSDEEASSILYDWEGVWARPNQLVYDWWPEPVILFCAGRGFGKTRVGAEWVRNRAKNGAQRIAFVGPTSGDVRDTMVLGDSGIMGVCPDDEKPEYEPSKSRLVFPNGVVANLMSAETPERARGANRSHIWGDEIGSWENKDMYDQLMLSLRLGESRFVGTTTPRANEIIVDLFKRAVFNSDPPEPGKDVRIIAGSTYENLHNLSKAFQSVIISAYEGTRLGSQELEGKLLLNAEGALWTVETLAKQTLNQHDELPRFEKVAIGVDPATSNTKKSDKTGIVVAGLGVDGNGYVLGDFTDRYSPQAWVTKVLNLYDQYAADAPTVVIVEKNQGGDIIRDTLTANRPFLPVDDIFSTSSKMSRAEPVALMYEQGRVFHIQGMSELEGEMTTYEGTGKSPDRLDACVFAITNLFPLKKHYTKTFDVDM